VRLLLHQFVACAVSRALNVTMQNKMPDFVGKVEATAVTIVLVSGQED
jgi:putative uncharacterized protein (fragment)